MVHIIFEDEEETEQTGKQNFKGLGKSDEQRRNKQPKNPSMPDKYSSGKYRETRKKNYKYQYSKKRKGLPIVGKRLFSYEENELMTRYDGFWVLKEGVEKLAQLKSTVEEEMLGNKEMKKKLLAAKRLAHSKLRRELMKRQKQKNMKLSLKEGESLKTPKEIQSSELKKYKKSKKPSADSNVVISLSKSETGSGKNKVKGITEHSTLISESSKEKDQQIVQNKKKSKKNVQSANSQTVSQERVNTDLSPPNKKNMRKNNDKVKQTTKGSKRKFLETDTCSEAQNHETASQKELRRKGVKMESEEKDTVICTAQNKNIVSLKFEENDLMTQFEGSWVKRTAVPELNHLREEHLKHIYSARENENSDEELTKVEQQHYHRLMKKKIRMEYRKLRKELTIQGRKECKEMD